MIKSQTCMKETNNEIYSPVTLLWNFCGNAKAQLQNSLFWNKRENRSRTVIEIHLYRWSIDINCAFGMKVLAEELDFMAKIRRGYSFPYLTGRDCFSPIGFAPSVSVTLQDIDAQTWFKSRIEISTWNRRLQILPKLVSTEVVKMWVALKASGIAVILKTAFLIHSLTPCMLQYFMRVSGHSEPAA